VADRPNEETRRFVQESFLEDMAEHQRRYQGQLPTTRANEELVAQTLNQLENERAEAPPELGPLEVSIEEPEAKVAAKAKEKGWSILRAPEGGVVIPHTSAERIFNERAGARIDLLLKQKERGPLGQPSWEERALAVLRTWMVDRKRGVFELLELLEASVQPFGDWKNEPAKPLIFI